MSGNEARDVVRRLASAVEERRKVLIGFTLSDLFAESFTFKHGERSGETGISLKARLLRVSWAKIDGEPFFTEHAA